MSFELVRIGGEGEEVGDAVEADAGAKKSRPDGECAQNGIAAGAAAHDHQAIWIGQISIYKVLGSSYGVLDIEETPIAVQGFHVLAPVSGAAAIIEVENRPAATGKVLIFSFETGLDRTGWPTVDHDD